MNPFILRYGAASQARRSKIFVNTLCNYKCEFCFHKHERHLNKDCDVQKQILSVANYGILDVDFTGGEPTLDPRFFEYLGLASSKFRKIAVVSNGERLSDVRYFEECQRLGLNEVVLSIHGPNALIHDTVTGIPGSFAKVLKAAENAKSLGILLRLNTTVSPRNQEYLPEHAVLAKEIGPTCQNFLSLNFWEDNEDYNGRLNFGLASEGLREAFSCLEDVIPYLTARYWPFCCLRGFERHVLGIYQHIYDPFDWNVELDELPVIGDWVGTEFGETTYTHANASRDNQYYKPKACLGCALVYICDGVMKQFSSPNFISPYKGDLVLDPLFFCGKYLSHDRYGRYC